MSVWWWWWAVFSQLGDNAKVMTSLRIIIDAPSVAGVLLQLQLLLMLRMGCYRAN